mmetsp:Transcript_11945/g.37370  ORF Transcript_11945/g.37370 Transcript_11945/m.37370 type:complete len:96 (+) Transcript_11945:724-1011(+)
MLFLARLLVIQSAFVSFVIVATCVAVFVYVVVPPGKHQQHWLPHAMTSAVETVGMVSRAAQAPVFHGVDAQGAPWTASLAGMAALAAARRMAVAR